jgi:hypothetical protein
MSDRKQIKLSRTVPELSIDVEANLKAWNMVVHGDHDNDRHHIQQGYEMRQEESFFIPNVYQLPTRLSAAPENTGPWTLDA